MGKDNLDTLRKPSGGIVYVTPSIKEISGILEEDPFSRHDLTYTPGRPNPACRRHGNPIVRIEVGNHIQLYVTDKGGKQTAHINFFSTKSPSCIPEEFANELAGKMRELGMEIHFIPHSPH